MTKRPGRRRCRGKVDIDCDVPVTVRLWKRRLLLRRTLLPVRLIVLEVAVAPGTVGPVTDSVLVRVAARRARP